MLPFVSADQDGLPVWEGSSLQEELRSQGHLSSTRHGDHPHPHQHQQEQQQDGEPEDGLQRVHDALVANPTCFTDGLGLDAWHYEGCVTATAAVHVASQRNQGVYGYNAPRCVHIVCVCMMVVLYGNRSCMMHQSSAESCNVF